jgi:hypothetical protein
MSASLTTLEDFMKKYIENQKLHGGADTLDTYKHKTGADYDRTFARALESLYAKKFKSTANYGQNYRNLSDKGLQNSGYSKYIDELSQSNFKKGERALKGERDLAEAKTLSGYANYLEGYKKQQNAIKQSVSSHLIDKGVVNLDDAVAYGLSQGLTEADAIAIGKNAYTVNKQKVFNDIISQVAALGLDRDGTVMLAKKMGVTDEDAELFGDEISEMLKHYSNISDGYLEYLEQNSHKNTNTFN